MNNFDRGIAEGYIAFDEEKKNIRYLVAGKRYRFTDPEESVRADAYLQLIFNYGYKPERIALEVTVPHRTPSNLADIVLFNDDGQKSPYIVVEAKKPGVSDAEFTQAIEQGFGNTNSLRAAYLWITSGERSDYFDVGGYAASERSANRIADIPRAGRKELSQAKFYKGGINEFDDIAFDIQTVTESELTGIFNRAHDSLWAGGKRSPEVAFDELDKLIFCKIWDEKRKRRRGAPYDFQNYSQEESSTLSQRIKAIYEEGRKESRELFKEDIRLEDEELKTVVGYLAPINMGATDLDSKGRAFETFMDSFFRGSFGQYFTPRPVVKFIIDVLPFDEKSIVLDPACGSGGFLLYALDHIRREADEYCADDPVEHHKHWHDFAEHKLFGIEISESIARTAKMNMIIHDDGHTNVIAHDGLANFETIESFAYRNGSFHADRFGRNQIDVIPTNPPFGAVIKKSERNYMDSYEMGQSEDDWIKQHQFNKLNRKIRDSQKSEILFIEQCYNFLKAGGWMGMVIPDGILTNSSLQYVRDWIEGHFRIIAVVSLPQTAFSATGAGVKSSVLFLRKYDDLQVADIRGIKEGLQSELFAEEAYGRRLLALEAEKKRVISEGDAEIQHIENELMIHLEAHRNQGTLDKATERTAKANAKAAGKAHQQTDVYKEWKASKNAAYKERIDTVKEAMQEALTERMRQRVTNYPIFMAIAEDIGYDATGRDTGSNELEAIGEELKRFIAAIERGTDAAFL